jgi:hypothetical protein
MLMVLPRKKSVAADWPCDTVDDCWPHATSATAASAPKIARRLNQLLFGALRAQLKRNTRVSVHQIVRGCASVTGHAVLP